jgi:uncharacterized protein YceK
MRNFLLMLIMGCSGCAEIATQVAVQGGVQYAGEKYLISQQKPVTKCNIVNMTRGYKMCRVYKQYGRV